MQFKLKVYSIFEFGQRIDEFGNPHQEDYIFPEQYKLKDSDRLFILCDGMGGHESGEIASRVVCNAMGRSIIQNAPTQDYLFTEDMVQNAVSSAMTELSASENPASEKKMGTTMTMLKLHKDGATIAHIGDSRVYHIRPGHKILFRTRDHSLVDNLVSIGELTEEEARLSPQKNVITRAMQPGEYNLAIPDIYTTHDIQPGDYFFLCSDGMLENLSDNELFSVLSDSRIDDQSKVRMLIEMTSNNQDNHSAFIVHITDVNNNINQYNCNVNHVRGNAYRKNERTEYKRKRNRHSQNDPVTDIIDFIYKFRWVLISAITLILLALCLFIKCDSGVPTNPKKYKKVRHIHIVNNRCNVRLPEINLLGDK